MIVRVILLSIQSLPMMSICTRKLGIRPQLHCSSRSRSTNEIRLLFPHECRRQKPQGANYRVFLYSIWDRTRTTFLCLTRGHWCIELYICTYLVIDKITILIHYCCHCFLWVFHLYSLSQLVSAVLAFILVLGGFCYDVVSTFHRYV